MTSEEIKAAIERLGKYCNSTYEVMLAFMNYDYGNSADYGCTEFKGVLVDLLKQADPDTHIKLPLDADGVPIRVGDEVCGYNHPNGGVYCHAIVNPCVIAVGEMLDYSNGKGWQLWNTLDVHHYHEPTVSEILDELEGLRGTGDYESVVTRAAELAGMLRELLADE